MIAERASEPNVDGHRVVVRPRHGSMSDLVTRPSAVVRAFVSPHVTRHRYNKRQSDFSALKEYNDYLEETEAIIFNLCEGVETQARRRPRSKPTAARTPRTSRGGSSGTPRRTGGSGREIRG